MDAPSPHMLRALRQAQLYGHLVARNDRLYHPGGSHQLCSVQSAHEMVRSGWLILRDGRYEITPEGHQALERAWIAIRRTRLARIGKAERGAPDLLDANRR